ncbi:hypothetical protein TruAng_002682 [Truncatella angustata]|nr:hypothetical protein TruAng_002682 [Truncatella angustata]
MSAQLQSEAAFESGLLGFINRQWFKYRRPLPAGTSLEGQTAIVTGANSGLGLEASRQFLQLGLSTLIIAVRSVGKGDAAAKPLREAFPNANIEVWTLDMVSYDSIQGFAARCHELERIDIVILNAGIQTSQYTIVEATGHEQVLQVNYLSTALLSLLLLPILRSKRQDPSHPPVLCTVTSDMAYWSSLQTKGPVLAQLDRKEGYSTVRQYMGTKLLEMMFVTKLAEQVNADEVIVNMVSPGWCSGTAIGGESPGGESLLFRGLKALATRSVEVGSSTYIDATVVQGKTSHGSFCSDWTLRP